MGSSRHAIKWLNQLELRQRNPSECITALGDDLRLLAKKAYRSLDTDAQETIALNQLYKLISVEMKGRCIDHDCQSVQQAVCQSVLDITKTTLFKYTENFTTKKMKIFR